MCEMINPNYDGSVLRLKALTNVTGSNTACTDVIPCSLVEIYLILLNP